MKPSLAANLAVPLVTLALGLAASPAAAQPFPPQKLAAAQALFKQAAVAMTKADFATACPKLEEVTRILPAGVGGWLTLGQCYEGSGRLASAWSAYFVASDAAAQQRRPEMERRARERIGALEPRLAHLTIAVPKAIRGAPDLAITRDGAPVGPVQWGVPVPVDKGKHVVVATATGKQRWEKEVSVDADGTTVSVEVAALADGPMAAPVADAAPPEKAPFWSAPHVAGAAVGAAGVVGLVLGSAFGAVAIDKKNQSNEGHCVGNRCDTTGASLRSDGLSAATVSTGMFIAGGLALAAGVTLLALPAGKPATTGKAPAGAARVGIGLGTLDVSGTF